MTVAGGPVQGPVRGPVRGEVREATRTLTQADLDGFAELSGDDNPIHVDPAFAAGTPFRVPVAHGMFLYALVRAELRRWLPAARQVTQELTFPSATPVGATVRVRLEVLDTGGDGVRVATEVSHGQDETGLVGEAVLAVDAPAAAGATAPPEPEAPAVGPVPGPRDATWWGSAVGRQAEAEQRVSADAVQAYAALTGDAPPFGWVPEPLIAGMFSNLLGVDLPGPGTNYLKQRMAFPAPARIDDPLVASVRITRVRPDKRLVDLATRCIGGDGTVVCEGRALVLARGVPAPGAGD